jgi:hypothetical protein
VEQAKDGEGSNWVIKATVTEGPETGAVCSSYMGLPRGDNKDGGRISKIGGMLVALGLRTEAQTATHFAFDTAEALGRNCVVFVTEKGTNKAGQRDTEQTFVWPNNWNAAIGGTWNPKDAAKSAGRPPHPAGPGSTMLPPGQALQTPPQAPQQQWAPPPGQPPQQPPQGWTPPQGWVPPQ